MTDVPKDPPAPTEPRSPAAPEEPGHPRPAGTAPTDELPPIDDEPDELPYDPEAVRLERRLLIIRVATIASVLTAGVGALAYGYLSRRRAIGFTDNDPNDPRGGGRGNRGKGPVTGVTDNDPTDAEGKGRGTSQQVPKQSNDSDPADAVGAGKSK
jgi:hypothetical protein